MFEQKNSRKPTLALLEVPPKPEGAPLRKYLVLTADGIECTVMAHWYDGGTSDRHVRFIRNESTYKLLWGTDHDGAAFVRWEEDYRRATVAEFMDAVRIELVDDVT